MGHTLAWWGKSEYAVGLRVNTLRTCTEQLTVQVLTRVLIHTLQTSQKGTTRYKYSTIWGIPLQA